MISFKQGDTKQLEYIDFFKGIGIAAVLLVHYGLFFVAPNGLLKTISEYGSHGVQVFFIISTFLIWRSISRKYHKGSFSYKDFYYSRFQRVVPLYYLTLVVYFALYIYRGGFIPWEAFLAHVLLINGFIPRFINNILGVEWYIADLIFLFLFSPVLFKLLSTYKKTIVGIVVSFLLAFFVDQLYGFLVSSGCVNDNYYNNAFFKTFCFVVQLPCMLLGVLLYFITDMPKYTKQKWSIILVLFALCLYLFSYIIKTFLMLD